MKENLSLVIALGLKLSSFGFTVLKRKKKSSSLVECLLMVQWILLGHSVFIFDILSLVLHHQFLNL